MQRYSIETPNPKEFCQAVNSRSFSYAKVRAWVDNNGHVQVQSLRGNCIDELDGIMDRFPGSFYLVEK